MLETYLLTIWHSGNSLLMAHCTSYAKNCFCRQEENQGTKFIAFLIDLLTLPTKTVLLLVPDLARFSKQLISYGPQKATGVTDCRWVQATSKSVRSKSPFPASKQDPPFLDPCGYWTRWQRAWECKRRCDKRRLLRCRITTTHQLLQGRKAWRRAWTAMD